MSAWLHDAMRLIAVTLAGVIIGAGLPATPASAADDDRPRRVVLGGVTVRLEPGTRQVITVRHRAGWHATVTLWRKSDGRWEKRMTARDGRTGYGGLVAAADRRQGDGTTPLGTYRLTEAFGNARRPADTVLPFHRVRRGDYWVQDNASRYYNTLRNKRRGGFRWWLPSSEDNSSERLADYGRQYAWSVVIDFNRPDPVRHRGSGIFLHVNGDGATAGCVSTPRRFVREALSRLPPGLHPVIAVGR